MEAVYTKSQELAKRNHSQNAARARASGLLARFVLAAIDKTNLRTLPHTEIFLIAIKMGFCL